MGPNGTFGARTALVVLLGLCLIASLASADSTASGGSTSSAAADGFISTAAANANAKLEGDSHSATKMLVTHCAKEKRKHCCTVDMRFMSEPEEFKKDRAECDQVFMRSCCTMFEIGKRDTRALRFVNELLKCIQEIVSNIFEFNFTFPMKCCDLAIFSFLPPCKVSKAAQD